MIRAVIGVGAVAGFLLAAQGDRIGRRRLLLITVVGYTAATLATALAQNLVWLAAAQVVAEIFLQGEWAVVSLDTGKRSVIGDRLKKMARGAVLVLEGGRIRLKKGGKKTFAVRLDPTRQPRECDITIGKDVAHAIYRLDGDDPSIIASGHTVFDMGVAKEVRR